MLIFSCVDLFCLDEVLKAQGSRESSPTTKRKKEKQRKLFNESSSKSGDGSNHPTDPGTIPDNII